MKKMKTLYPLILLIICSIFIVIPESFAQNSGRKASGTVTDEKGDALTGVSILIKGTSTGTASGLDGSFQLALGNTQNPVLVFSFVGYVTKEVSVSNPENLQVVMTESNTLLNEVVVVGYGTQKKRDLTGSVSSVSSKDLKSLPVTNAGEALQGRSSGVMVVSSGAPGSNVTIRVRGTGTINNSDPLLVIDGIPTNIPLNTINPDDIETYEILKDASASAIYGSRGANGVVIITTKRGSSEKNSLEFKMFTGVQTAANKVDMLNASEFAALHNEMMTNNGQAVNPDFADPSSLGEGTNWLDAMLRTSPVSNYTLSYSGGNQKSKYYVSGSVLDQQGIVINTSYRRYTLQLNSESKVFDWLSFGNNLTLNHDVKKSGDYNIRNAMAALPTQSIYNEDGTYSGPVGQSSWVGDITNPIGKAKMTENQTQGYNALGNIYAEISLLKDLKFKSSGGLQAQFWDDRTWAPAYNWQPTPQSSSYLYQQYNKSMTYLWDNYLTYDTRLLDKHHLTLFAGSSAQSNRTDYMNGSVQEFASNNTQQLTNGTGTKTLSGNASEWALLSFIGRANYDYSSKYLFTATIRRDGSSRFGANNRWGWFPSASAAWRISQEDFLKDQKWLDDLKLRVGYGLTGNQNIGNYSFASVLQTIQYVFNNQVVSAVVPLAIPNPGVRWEQVEQTNFGLDAAMFNGRLNVTLDAYIKNTNDMLVPMSVPISTGYSDIVVPSINAGKVQNKGVELGISSTNTTGALVWTTNFNISVNKNRVISLNDSVPIYTGSIGLNQNLSIQKAGYPVNAFYGFVTNGLFQTPAEVENYAVQVPGEDPYNRTSAGDIKFADLNNDGKIDDNDRTYIGNPNPKVIFAMNNTFTWKGFDLSVFLQGVYGNQIFNANRIYQEGMAVAQNQTTEVLNRWVGEGTSNSIPRAVFNDPNKNTRVSDRFIEDGSYLKVKNLTFGYSLPKALVSKAKLTSVRVYFSAENLLTFTKYSGFDPEVPVNGIDLNVYPVTRTMSGGINLVF